MYLSVIVPVYNCTQYIDRCIESIVSQSFKEIELILVDDGSTDDSGVRCDEWAAKDSRITVIHRENGGLSAARNTGIEHATSEYITFVDADDMITPYLLEPNIKILKQNFPYRARGLISKSKSAFRKFNDSTIAYFIEQ